MPSLPQRLGGALGLPAIRLSRALAVPSALKFPGFRNYWIGLLVGVTGYQMLVLLSLGWLVSHQLAGDARYLGYMSAAIAVPAILLNLFSGVYADKLDPKGLLALCQSATGLVVGGLAVLVLRGDVAQWHVVVAAFLIGTVQAFDNPARQSIFARMVDREALPSAVALNSAVWTGTRMLAPSLAGIIIGRTSLSTAMFISAGGFVAFTAVALSLRLRPVPRAQGGLLQEMLTGFRFVKDHPLFGLLIGMTFFNAMSGMSYVFLMPVFADDVLDVGVEKLGWLMGAGGLGALGGSGIAANLGSSRRRGWILLAGGGLFGFFLILFAAASNGGHYELSMAALFLADMCSSISLMMVMTTLQALVPDHYRGRVMGLYSITWSLVPMGALLSSQVAHHRGPPEAVALGGALVCLMTLGIGVGSRRVRSLGAQAELRPAG